MLYLGKKDGLERWLHDGSEYARTNNKIEGGIHEWANSGGGSIWGRETHMHLEALRGKVLDKYREVS